MSITSMRKSKNSAQAFASFVSRIFICLHTHICLCQVRSTHGNRKPMRIVRMVSEKKKLQRDVVVWEESWKPWKHWSIEYSQHFRTWSSRKPHGIRTGWCSRSTPQNHRDVSDEEAAYVFCEPHGCFENFVTARHQSTKQRWTKWVPTPIWLRRFGLSWSPKMSTRNWFCSSVKAFHY